MKIGQVEGILALVRVQEILTIWRCSVYKVEALWLHKDTVDILLYLPYHTVEEDLEALLKVSECALWTGVSA